MKKDEEEEFTFTGGRGNSTIDYVLGDEEVREEIEELRIGDKINSDHHPVEVKVKGRKRGRMIGKKERKERRGVWDEEGRKEFRQKLGECGGMRNESIERQWKEMEEKLKRALRELEEKREEEIKIERRRGWWDEECRKEKKRVKRMLRNWRKREGEEKEYRRGKRGYKEMCKRKKKEENEKWEKKVERAKRENEVWEIVNRERRKRRRVNENIEMEEWKKYFMRLLGRVEGRVVKGMGIREVGGKEERDIGEEEIKRAIRRLGKGKASGIDGIPGEVWKYGGEEIERWAGEFCNRIWRVKGWPEEWKERIIMPIVKKREGGKVNDYRDVMLLPTLYKLYVSVLAERLNEEIEGKEIVPPNQTRFRRGMGTVDNIYAINYLINKQLERKEGKLVALFVDLKEAFDSTERY